MKSWTYWNVGVIALEHNFLMLRHYEIEGRAGTARWLSLVTYKSHLQIKSDKLSRPPPTKIRQKAVKPTRNTFRMAWHFRILVDKMLANYSFPCQPTCWWTKTTLLCLVSSTFRWMTDLSQMLLICLCWKSQYKWCERGNDFVRSPATFSFLKTSIFHLDWLLHVAQIQVRSLTKCSVNVRDVSLHRGQAICIEHDVVKQKFWNFKEVLRHPRTKTNQPIGELCQVLSDQLGLFHIAETSHRGQASLSMEFCPAPSFFLQYGLAHPSF